MPGIPDIPSLIRQLDSRSRGGSVELWRQLVDAGPAAVGPLLQAMQQAGRWDYQVWWLEALRGLWGHARGALAEALRSEDPAVRRFAAAILRRQSDPETVALLAPALRDRDRQVRMTAAEALAWMEDAGVSSLLEALEGPDGNARTAAMWGFCWRSTRGPVRPAPIHELLQALAEGPPSVRALAAEALGIARDPLALEPLLQAVDDSSSRTRAAAVSALARYQGPRVGEALIRALDDPDRSVRGRAAWGLGRLKETRALQPLIGALDDPTPGVRQGAADSLAELGEPAAIPALGHALAGQRARPGSLCRALSRFGPAAAPVLLQALDDSRPHTRIEAARALAGMGMAPVAVDPLIEALGDSNRWVRESAFGALRGIGLSSVAPLIHTLGDADPLRRRLAAGLLGEMKAQQAVEPLRRLLRDTDPYVRTRARRALRELGVSV